MTKEVDVEMPDVDGWSDAISKILARQVQGGFTFLCKAKHDEDDEEMTKEQIVEQRKKRKQKRKWEEMARVKPTALDRNYESSLRKIATKGIIQLFNAVQMQRKDTNTQLKKAKTVGKKEKVMKGVTKETFMEMLESETSARKDEEKEKKQPEWIRDDFMKPGKMQDWDKDDEESD